MFANGNDLIICDWWILMEIEGPDFHDCEDYCDIFMIFHDRV